MESSAGGAEHARSADGEDGGESTDGRIFLYMDRHVF